MNEQSLFAQVLDIPDPAERSAFLDRECGGNPDLRRRLERLLERHQSAGSFLEHPVIAPDDTQAFAAAGGGADEEPGTVIGPYKLLEKIGEGGMGAVYVAEQTEPVRRKVALKIIKPGMDSAQVVARFEAERQALALMDHPNIARVFDGGTIGARNGERGARSEDPDLTSVPSSEFRVPSSAGRPYFVMELVRGLPVTDYCDQARLSVPDRLRLFVHVCRAVQHAHQKGVIHRDLKPSNVLVTVIDGAPVPKVIDFGIAKATGAALTDRTLHTGFHQLVGTPLYMSPEQAELSGVDVDTRSDVYSLGVLLYELLTGTTPFDAETFRQAGFDGMRRLIREVEPARPSERISTLNAEARSTLSGRRKVDERQLGRQLRGELDWVVMRALEKDRNRRYESASAFAVDVERYLAGEPVEAHPPSRWYRLRKFARRNRVGLGVTGMAVVLLVTLGWAAADWGGRRAGTHRAVEEAMAESNDLQSRGNYPEALNVARRAEGLALGGAAGRQVRERVGRRKTDLELVLRLEEILLERTVVKDNHSDWELADRRYGEEFRAAGIDVDELTAVAAAGRLAATTVVVELATALDNWARDRRPTRGKADTSWRHLLEVARLADPDPWRCRLREARVTEDRRTLEELAGSWDGAVLPPSSAVLLGSALRMAGAKEQAVALLRRAQQWYPGDFWLVDNLGEALGDTPPVQLEEAIRFHTAAVAIRPQSDFAHHRLGRALLKKGQLDEAIVSYKETVRLKPDNFVHHYNLGIALQSKGRLDEAIASYKEAIRFMPGLFQAHNNLGNALRAKGQLDDAIASYKEAIDLKPDEANFHNNLGNAWDSKGRVDEAIASYREAVRLKPDDGGYHYNLGRMLSHKGQFEEAITSYKEAVRLKPDYVPPHYLLAWLLANSPDVKHREIPRAIELAERAVELAPAGVFGWNALGVARYRAGDWNAAVEAMNKAMELRIGGAAADWFFLAMAHWQLGEKDQARTWYDKAVAWMDKNKPQDEELRRFRAEAAELLGLLAPPPRPKDLP